MAAKPKELYVRNAVIVDIVDADTVRVDIDLGFDCNHKLTVRLEGIDAPEMRTAKGKEAKAYLESIMPEGSQVTIQTFKDNREKYGRYLAKLFVPGVAASVNDTLIAQGHAKAYDGGKRT